MSVEFVWVSVCVTCELWRVSGALWLIEVNCDWTTPYLEWIPDVICSLVRANLTINRRTGDFYYNETGKRSTLIPASKCVRVNEYQSRKELRLKLEPELDLKLLLHNRYWGAGERERERERDALIFSQKEFFIRVHWLSHEGRERVSLGPFHPFFFAFHSLPVCVCVECLFAWVCCWHEEHFYYTSGMQQEEKRKGDALVLHTSMQHPHTHLCFSNCYPRLSLPPSISGEERKKEKWESESSWLTCQANQMNFLTSKLWECILTVPSICAPTMNPIAASIDASTYWSIPSIQITPKT